MASWKEVSPGRERERSRTPRDEPGVNMSIFHDPKSVDLLFLVWAG